MKNKEIIEFITLNTLLDDKIVCNRLLSNHPGTFKRMLDRYTDLIDKVVKQYELPNLNKDPLKD